MDIDFSARLENMDVRYDWGEKLACELNCQLLADEAFRASRLENLVAGFSNMCQLDCTYCGVHQSQRLNIPAEELDVARLIDLINRHKEQSGFNLGHFRIGNTGEPLIHKQLISLISQTQDSVNYYSIVSNMSIKDRRIVEFIAGHPKVEWVNVSCDAGDKDTYSKLRVGGDFQLVFDNAKILRGAGKRLVLNAVVFKENENSLYRLPALIADAGFRELHIFYPLNTNVFLNQHGLHKPTLSEFREFFLQMRTLCENHSIKLTTDGWAYRPELTGVIPDINTEEMFATYADSPCDALYHLILYPSGSYNNCSILNRLGLAMGKEERPFYRWDLLEMLNIPEVLTLRKLQVLGYFPPPCKNICGKADRPRDVKEAQLILKLKYPDKNAALSIEDFIRHLRESKGSFVVRALSPAMRAVFEVYPDLHGYLDFIVDRDPKLSYHDHRVIPPEGISALGDSRKHAVLIASDRGAVFNSILKQLAHFKEIYKLDVSGSDPRDFTVQRLLP